MTNDSINEIFGQLGPTPRLCFDYQYIPDGFAAYSRDLTTAIAEATPSKIEGLLKAAESLSMDSISQKIYLICRAKQDEVASWPVVTPPFNQDWLISSRTYHEVSFPPTT